MNENQKTLHKFYAAFATSNYQDMISCYHPNVVFTDPIFHTLGAKDALNMWKMLLEKGEGKTVIEYSNISANENEGTANWVATYLFSATNRRVVNRVRAKFIFQDGLIIKHTDTFDLYKWSQQAFGFKGYLMGWTGFMKEKIHENAVASLASYSKRKYSQFIFCY